MQRKKWALDIDMHVLKRYFAYQNKMPFNLITTKNEDIKALEKEHNEITGQIILKEKALENTFAMLEKHQRALKNISRLRLMS